MRLQVQQAVDEEVVRRFGPEVLDSIRRSSCSALADKMLEAVCVTEEIIHPDADEGKHGFNPIKRFYRFSVQVGHADQAKALVDERVAGRREAIQALKHILEGSGDYDGALRGYLSRWLNGVPDAAIDYAVAQIDQN